MVKVLRHGNTIRVKDPATGKTTVLTDVTFVEEGRSGANKSLSTSNDVFSQLFGRNMGLDQRRTHTQPFKQEELINFPVHQDFGGESDKTFPFYINRTMYSTPQMRQQVNVAPRMIDGKPTYFTTAIEAIPAEDADKRDSAEITAKLRPQLWDNAIVGTAEVEILELVQPTQTRSQVNATQDEAGIKANQPAEVGAGHEPLPS
jgi:hypothetical protein